MDYTSTIVHSDIGVTDYEMSLLLLSFGLFSSAVKKRDIGEMFQLSSFAARDHLIGLFFGLVLVFFQGS